MLIQVQTINSKIIQNTFQLSQVQVQYKSKMTSRNLFKSEIQTGVQNIQLTQRQVQRIVDLGFRMKLILMQPDALKLTEQIMKIIRKMNSATFSYKQRCLNFVQRFKMNALLNLYQNQSPTKIKQKSSEKQYRFDNLQMSRQLLIQKIVQQLSNARQDALRMEQLDPSLNFSNNQDSQPEEKDNGISLTLNRNQSEDGSKQMEQLKKTITKLQSDMKNNKKLLEQTIKPSLQKDEKIQNLKTKISKLEEHIIRQVKSQGQGQQKATESINSELQTENSKLKMLNQSNLIKSEALQKQVVVLRREIENLKTSLTQSAQCLASKQSSSKQSQKQKQKQFLALSRQYAAMKQEVSLLINEKKLSTTHFGQQQHSQQFDNNDLAQENSITLRAQLQIAKQRYIALEKAYINLKEQYEQQRQENDSDVRHSTELSIRSNQDFLDPKISKSIKSRKKSSGANLKQNRSSQNSKKTMQMGSDDEDIIRDISEINKIQKMTEQIGITGFDSIINPTEMASKIQGFDYTNSIIYKVNSSKFIQTFQAKLSFILQYTCLLELYFSKNFRSSLRQELMMEQTICIRSATLSDLNEALFMDTSQVQQGSFTQAMNSSKISNSSSPNRAMLANQITVGQFSKTNPAPRTKNTKQMILADSLPLPISSPEPENKKHEQNRYKIQKLQAQFKQILTLIPNQYLNPHELRDDPQFMTRVIKLRHNSVAQIIANLVKENQVFKKCLNQMIRNEENFTKINNQIYFDQDGELRRRSSSGLHPKGPLDTRPGKEKDNCLIM